ncbi:hypothetical protein ACWGM0_10465 [Sphingomonas bisphenolicum]
MSYWIKRIALKTGEIVTEHELREDENLFSGPVPVVGDTLEIECRGRKFLAKIVWGNWPGRMHPDDVVVPLRVSEMGLDETQTPLWLMRRVPGQADQKIMLGGSGISTLPE